jgi:solute carrier family 45 protein 1/2/4
MWSIEMAYGEQPLETRFPTTLSDAESFVASPYLLSLGLSKSYMALVFVAGPLSGLIVQPLIGLFDHFPSIHGSNR